MRYRKHTIESLEEIASNFSSRGELQRGDFSAYQMCRYYGLLDKFFPETVGKGKDNDAVYLMVATDFTWGINRQPIYKFGATSARLPDDCRRVQQNICSGITHEYVIKQTPVVGKATDVEKYAHSLGRSVFEASEIWFPGHTEYRAYSAEDVQAIKDMVELCAM